MGKFKDLLNNENNFKLVRELDGKPVRLLMDNSKSFKLIDPKTGKQLKVLMDDRYSFRLVNTKLDFSKYIADNKDSFKLLNTSKEIKITLKDGTSFKLMTSKKKNAKKKEKMEVIGIENGLRDKSNFELFFTEKSFNLLEVIVTIVLVVVALVFILDFLKKDETNKDNNSSLNGYESIKDQNLTEFIDLYTNITDNYYNDIDSGEMLNIATEAMLEYLGDNFSGYIEASQARDFMDRLNGRYQGLGFEITTDEDGKTYVTHIFEHSNAYKSGIKVGDRIVSVAGIDVTEKNSSELSLLIKEKLNGLLTIVVERNKKELEFTIEKGEVIINAVSSEMFGTVGYLKIDTFSTAAISQVVETLKDLENRGMTSLVVDVRYNNGGYLDSAFKIADIFIEKGKVIYKLKTNKETTVHKALTADKKNYEVAVLINGTSASASEVFALAMKDSYGATLIGARSYGKGTVQETTELSSGSLVKYTIANWLGPKDENIDNKGIDPDIYADMGSAYIKEQTYENDGQLQQAIKVVSE